MSVVKIRKVDGDDADLDMLHRETFEFPIEPLLSIELGTWWLGYDGEHPIAFCSLHPSQRFGNAGYFSRAGVLPSHRGFGLQKRLIRVRLREAKRLGYNVVYSDTTDNPASANSLIRCGFHTYSPASPYSYSTSIYWRKFL